MGVAATPAMAQDQVSAAAAPAENTIVVTGSRIRRSNETAAVPVQMLNRADLDEVGTVDTAEIILQLPGVDADITPDNSALSTQNAGLSTINLRRLGSDRTLVLIDGRRVVSNSGNGERVSLNTIPAGFVKSIEVTTGGASAIYGSDAIAGVANILLEDSLDGFRGNVRYGKADRSGEQETTVDLTLGKKFADGRGYVLLGVTYDRETAIFADETRPDSLRGLEWRAPNVGGWPDETDLPGCDDSGRYCFAPGLSSSLPGGRFESGDAWNVDGVWFNDKSLQPQDGRPAGEDFVTDVDGYNFRPGRTLSPLFESINGAFRGTFDITPSVSLFANALYSAVDTRTRTSPRTAASTTDIGVLNELGDIGQMPASHPFIPPEVEETRSGTVSWSRRFNELGMREKINKRDTFRLITGAEGFFGPIGWEVYGTYGRFEQRQTTLNEVNYLNIRNALDIEADGSGGYQCVDAAARADGCVPLDMFGTNSISPAAADYIRYTANLKQIRQQYTAGGSINGDLFEIPAGPVKFAAGFEYRKEKQNTIGDPDNEFELTSASVIPNIKAQFDVIEGFAEADIPIIEDMLSLQLAGRVANYSTIGTIFSYNAGGSFTPVDGLRIRGQYSRSQRAPTITEFFSAPRGDADDLRDPCDGLMPDGTGITPAPGSAASAATIAANCLAEPGIQAFFNDPENAGEAFEFDGSVSGPNAGNQNLKEETADTFTIGAVIAPSFLPNFSLIVDYYNIKVKGAIGTISTQLTADLCYGDANFPDNRFCSVITRDASSGRVIQVINQEENLNSRKVSGLDVSANYRAELGFLPGSIDFDVRYAHYFEDEYTFLSVGGPQTGINLGEIGYPKDEFRAKVGYSAGGFRATWTTVYRSGGVDDNAVLPGEDAFFRADAQDYHNFYVGYSFRENPRLSIYAGVNNVFDKVGPFMPDGLNYGSSQNLTSSLNDLEGREFFGGVRVQF